MSSSKLLVQSRVSIWNTCSYFWITIKELCLGLVLAVKKELYILYRLGSTIVLSNYRMNLFNPILLKSTLKRIVRTRGSRWLLTVSSRSVRITQSTFIIWVKLLWICLKGLKSRSYILALIVQKKMLLQYSNCGWIYHRDIIS